MKFHTILSIIILFSLSTFNISASEHDNVMTQNSQKVYYQKLNDNIYPGAWRTIKKGVETAEDENVKYYILELNTYGGDVNTADSIRTKLLNTKIPTIVWINDNAASAGALISISCDSIFMTQSAKIGASTVVNGLTGEGAIDKYQSYMRATFRSTAEAQGRDPDIAEAMVDQDIEVEGVIEKEKTLTFTTSEAIKNGYCEGIINSRQELLDHIELTEQDVIEYEASSVDGLIGWLMNPAVSGFLITIILGGIYLELKTPGLGLGAIAAIGATLLYFAPYYLEGLAANWEIILFFIGVLLLIVEVFFIPGFGIFGVAGIICIISGLSFAMVGNDFFDFSGIPTGNYSKSLFTVLVSTIGSILLLFLLGGSILNSNSFKSLELSETQDAADGYTVAVSEEAALVGRTGVAITDLRISGRIKVADQIFDVITNGEYIEEGTEVILEKYQGRYFIVKKKV